MNDEPNLDSALSYKDILALLDKEGVINKCQIMFKHRQDKIIAYCNWPHCHFKTEFMKYGHLYAKIDKNNNHNHVVESEKTESDEYSDDDNKSATDKGEYFWGPIKESLLESIREYIAGQKNVKFKELLTHLKNLYVGSELKSRNSSYLYKKFFQTNWMISWQKVKPYVDRLEEVGINASIEYLDQNNPTTVKYIYFETPYSDDFTKSSAFPRVLMVEGTFLKPLHVKAILLILSTITADHIALPLSAAIVDAECTESYRFLFEKSMHLFENNRGKITIIADEQLAI